MYAQYGIEHFFLGKMCLICIVERVCIEQIHFLLFMCENCNSFNIYVHLSICLDIYYCGHFLPALLSCGSEVFIQSARLNGLRFISTILTVVKFAFNECPSPFNAFVLLDTFPISHAKRRFCLFWQAINSTKLHSHTCTIEKTRLCSNCMLLALNADKMMLYG